MKKRDILLEKYQSQANESDIKKINSKIEKMDVGKIKEIWTKVQALYDLARDPSAGWGSKAMAIGSLIYLISPIDAVPDMIPVLGLSDDAAIIIATAVKLASELNKYISERQVANYEYIRNLEAEKYQAKKKLVMKSIIVIGIFAIIITAIIKFL